MRAAMLPFATSRDVKVEEQTAQVTRWRVHTAAQNGALDDDILARLPERRTGPTLGDMQLRSHLLDAGTATRGA
jgi:hypothetical protein